MDKSMSSDAPSSSDTLQISKTTLRTIMDQLQRLNKNSEDHEQLIHDLRSELSSLKGLDSQVEALKEENSALKKEVEGLRLEGQIVQRPKIEEKTITAGISNSEREGTDCDSVMTKEEEIDLNEETTCGPRGERKQATKTLGVVEVAESDDNAPENAGASRPTRKRRLPSRFSESAVPVSGAKRIKREIMKSTTLPSSPTKQVTPAGALAVVAKVEKAAVKVELLDSKAKEECAAAIPTPGSSSSGATPGSRTKIPSNKIKAEALFFPKTVLEEHLAGASTLAISPLPLSLKMHLPFLSTEYRAATQALLWTNDPSLSPGKKSKSAPSTIRRFMYPNFETNPDLPAAPGEPGLLLCGRTEPVFDSKPWSLFIRVIDDGTTLKRWTYAGEYTCALVGHLSASAFKAQPSVVKQTWGKKIAFHKKHPAYRDMRVRMTLRKHGQAINEESMKKEREKVGKTKKGDEGRLSIQDVVEAFERGDEVIPIIRLQCASYNHEFARELATKYAQYKPKQKNTAESDSDG